MSPCAERRHQILAGVCCLAALGWWAWPRPLWGEDKPVPVVSVSSVENEDLQLAGEHVLDDNPRTRWASAWSDPQWIQLDFGAEKDMDLVTLHWETAYGRRYELQVSNNGKTWSTVFRQNQGEGGTETLYLGLQRARYLRLMGLERGTEWGYSLFAMKVEARDDRQTPAPPQSISGHAGQDAVFLYWAANVELDLKEYRVYRSQPESQSYQPLAVVSAEKTYAKDSSAAMDQEYLYYVTAVDYSGRESSPSEKVRLQAGAAKASSLFSIPAAAWTRYLGDVPQPTQSSSPNRGVALGGFGAGGFMYNLSGSFGPFQSMDQVIYRGEWLGEAAFHFYECWEGEPARVKTLATDPKLKSAWDRLRVGEGRYHALQPRGWMTFDAFRNHVAMEFFSPVLPNNYRETSYPLAVWEFKIHNPTGQACRVGVMLTFPDVFIGQTPGPDSFHNQVQTQGGVQALILKADDGRGEWCLAAPMEKGMECSFVTGWDAAANGQDIWQDFSADGRLSNATLTPGRNLAVALAVTTTLQPGETRHIPMVLCWDFPVVRFGQGTEWWKKYTQYFGRRGNNSLAMARQALRLYPRWQQDLSAWMQPVLENPNYPEWLKRAAFNELYYSQFGGSFYTAGLKKRSASSTYPQRRPDRPRYFEMECMMYPFANTFDVRHYSSLIFARFWPQIEKQILWDWADAILVFDPLEHQTPHDAGMPDQDPYFAWDGYGTNRHHWKDLHSKFIQQCWRYWHIHKDRAFLKEVWPACKATYGYMKKTDTDGDGLPNNVGSDNTYDAWGLYGTSLLCGGLWVGALEAMRAMAQQLHDPILPEVETLLAQARLNLDRQLWMEDRQYYRIDTASPQSDAMMADGLNGQRYGEAYGLPDILPASRLRAHLRQVYQRCVVPLHDFNGDGVGECGALNGVGADGSWLKQGQSDEIWTGASYFLAASMHHAGLKAEALATAYGIYYLTYEEESTAYWFNTPEAWHDRGLRPRPEKPEQYQRPRAVWELLLEIDDPFLPPQ